MVLNINGVIAIGNFIFHESVIGRGALENMFHGFHDIAK